MSSRRHFLKTMLTCCCSIIKVLSFLFFTSPVPSFHSATFWFAQPKFKQVFTVRRAALFAENCTTSDEYGLQLQPISGRYVTDLARSSVCTLSQLFSERHCERLISIQKGVKRSQKSDVRNCYRTSKLLRHSKRAKLQDWYHKKHKISLRN